MFEFECQRIEMALELNEIVPWGRSFQEYVAMFALSEEDLSKPILGCGAGPASFNAELTEHGETIVSIDPLCGFGADDVGRPAAAMSFVRYHNLL